MTELTIISLLGSRTFSKWGIDNGLPLLNGMPKASSYKAFIPLIDAYAVLQLSSQQQQWINNTHNTYQSCHYVEMQRNNFLRIKQEQ